MFACMMYVLSVLPIKDALHINLSRKAASSHLEITAISHHH